jgi:hypothetical protein
MESSSKTEWIECRVSPGMFSDERAVELGERSFFVDEGAVRNVGQDGRAEVEVQLVERGGEKWAVLPTSSRETVLLA